MSFKVLKGLKILCDVLTKFTSLLSKNNFLYHERMFTVWGSEIKGVNIASPYCSLK